MGVVMNFRPTADGIGKMRDRDAVVPEGDKEVDIMTDRIVLKHTIHVLYNKRNVENRTRNQILIMSLQIRTK